jgi:hypothetical protein
MTAAQEYPVRRFIEAYLCTEAAKLVCFGIMQGQPISREQRSPPRSKRQTIDPI